MDICECEMNGRTMDFELGNREFFWAFERAKGFKPALVFTVTRPTQFPNIIQITIVSVRPAWPVIKFVSGITNL